MMIWKTMVREGVLCALIPWVCGVLQAGTVTVKLQSSDTGPASGGQHGGRPYHLFDDEQDEAIYVSAREWQGGHHPNDPILWPISDGIIDWDTTTDPEGAGPEAVLYQGEDVYYVYWDTSAGEYALVEDEGEVPPGLEKAYYEDWMPGNRSMSIGNNGVPAPPPPPPPFYPTATADRQHALLAEFALQRAYEQCARVESLTGAWIELTFDRVIDMALNNDPSLPLPSQLYVNAFEGDGVVGRFEWAQQDYERINHAEAEATVWLTMDGTPTGYPITDFNLSYYRLITNPGEQFTISIDVTDAVRDMLDNQAGYAGFVLSTSNDGDYCLGSVDLVDDSDPQDIKNYLPALVLEVVVRPGDFDCDLDVDQDDLAVFKACVSGPTVPYDPEDLPTGCALIPDSEDIIAADFDRDTDVDQSDFGIIQRCFSGSDTPADPHCGD